MLAELERTSQSWIPQCRWISWIEVEYRKEITWKTGTAMKQMNSEPKMICKENNVTMYKRME